MYARPAQTLLGNPLEPPKAGNGTDDAVLTANPGRHFLGANLQASDPSDRLCPRCQAQAQVFAITDAGDERGIRVRDS